ncbi:MAG: hypothetical protein KDI33_12450 [Halioglobus sp.]|nr:hypothetical protein [Halioglobus sp.]
MASKSLVVIAVAKVAILGLMVASGAARATPVLYSVLLESNQDRSINEIYLANYNSYPNLLSNSLDASSSYSSLNVSSSFRVGGYTQDNNGYSVLLESNTDRTTNEIYLANYASYDDLLTNLLLPSSSYSALNVSSSFSVGGYTFDGSSYSVLLESNDDRTNNEIYLANYASYADLLSNTLSPDSGYSALNVSSSFSVGGFTFDGSGYSVLLESNEDRTSNEIYIAYYATWADLLSNTLSPNSSYSDLNVSSAFSVGGLAADFLRKPGDVVDPNDGGFPDDDRGDGGGLGGNPDDEPGDGGGSGGNPDDEPGDGGGSGGTPVPVPSVLYLLGISWVGYGLVVNRRRKLGKSNNLGS